MSLLSLLNHNIINGLWIYFWALNIFLGEGTCWSYYIQRIFHKCKTLNMFVWIKFSDIEPEVFTQPQHKNQTRCCFWRCISELVEETQLCDAIQGFVLHIIIYFLYRVKSMYTGVLVVVFALFTISFPFKEHHKYKSLPIILGNIKNMGIIKQGLKW